MTTHGVAPTKPKPRKSVTIARIELRLWFRTTEAYYAFASAPFARRAETVSERQWLSATDLSHVAEVGIEAVFRFTHTCRSDGAHNSDSKRFFHATRRAAYLLEVDAELSEVVLIDREKVPEQGTAPVPGIWDTSAHLAE